MDTIPEEDYIFEELASETTQQSFTTLVHGHLNSALNPAHLGFLDCFPWPYPQAYYKHQQEFLKVSDIEPSLKDPSYQCNINIHPLFASIMSQSFKLPIWDYEQECVLVLKTGVKYLTTDIHAVSKVMLSSSTPQEITTWAQLMPRWVQKLCVHYYSLRKFYGEAVNWTQQKLSREPHGPILHQWNLSQCKNILIHGERETIKHYVTPNLIITVDHINHKIIVGTREVLLLFSDTATQRFILTYSCYFGSQHNNNIYPKVETITRYIELGDKLLKLMGNSAYDILKCSEALCIGRLSRQGTKCLVDRGAFWKETTKGIFSKTGNDIKWTAAASEWIDFLDQQKNPHFLAQLFGLYRIWGHPWIDAKGGLKSMKSHATKQKLVDVILADKILFKFKETFFQNYKKQRGKYPAFEYTSETSSYLGEQLRLNKPFNIKDKRYYLEDFSHVQVKPIFELPQSYNLSSLLSDKAISLTKSQLYTQCNQKIPTVHHPTDRRAILAYLKSSYENPSDLLNEIDKEGMSDEDCIIGLVGKERELKIQARFFALMTLKCRLYFTLTEELLSEHILQYVPAITMKDSLLLLQKKMLNISRGVTSKFSLKRHRDQVTSTVLFNLDFTKWNLNMRAELTNPLFSTLGQLFGYSNLYTRTHEIFEKSTIYLADGTYIPEFISPTEIKPSEFAWTNHKGGFEGLRQKGWTLLTVMMLELVCQDQGVNYKITGQGDNQVLSVTFKTFTRKTTKNWREPAMKDLRGKYNSFLRVLEQTCLAAGLSLKILETWTSHNLYAYGKHLYWNGMLLSMSLKRLMRAFYLSNDSLATLDNSLGCVSANVQTAAMSDFDPIISLLTMKIEGINCLNALLFCYSPMMGGNALKVMLENKFYWQVTPRTGNTIQRCVHHDINQDQIKSLYEVILNFPRALGGFSITTCLSITERGFPDPATQALSWIKLLVDSSYTPTWQIPIYQGLMNPELNTSKDMEMLIQDPLAINLLLPSAGLGILSKEVESMLQNSQYVSNIFIQSIIKLINPAQQDHLITILSSLSPFWPRIAHDLYAATAIGFIKQCIAKVGSTVTIRKLAVKKGEAPIMYRLSLAEFAYVSSVFYKMICHQPPPMLECSRMIAQDLRDRGWGKPIKGITTPHPSEIFELEALKTGERCKGPCDFLIAYLSEKTRDPQFNATISAGPWIPYLGSLIKDKSPSYIFDTSREEPVLKKASKLFNLIHWIVDKDSQLHNFIQKNYNSLITDDKTVFIPDIQETSGSAHHRYQDEATKHGGLIGLNPSLGSHISMTSNHLTSYARKQQNVTLHFQAAFCCLATSSYGAILKNAKRRSMYNRIHLHLNCPNCIIPVDEESVDITCDKKITTDFFSLIKEQHPTKVDSSVFHQLKTLDDFLQYRTTTDITTLGEVEFKKMVYRNVANRITRAIFTTQDNWQISSFTTQPLDNAWWFRVKPISLLQAIAVDIIYRHLNFSPGQILNVSSSQYRGVLLKNLEKIHADNFSCLNQIWYDNVTYSRLKQDYPHLEIIRQQPIPQEEASDMSKRLLLDIIYRGQTTDQLASCTLYHESEAHDIKALERIHLLRFLVTETHCPECMVASLTFLNTTYEQSSEEYQPFPLSKVISKKCLTTPKCHYSKRLSTHYAYTLVRASIDALVRALPETEGEGSIIYRETPIRIQDKLLEVFSFEDLNSMRTEKHEEVPQTHIQFKIPNSRLAALYSSAWPNIFLYSGLLTSSLIPNHSNVLILGDKSETILEYLCVLKSPGLQVYHAYKRTEDGVANQDYAGTGSSHSAIVYSKANAWSPDDLSAPHLIGSSETVNYWGFLKSKTHLSIILHFPPRNDNHDLLLEAIKFANQLSANKLIITFNVSKNFFDFYLLSSLAMQSDLQFKVYKSPYALHRPQLFTILLTKYESITDWSILTGPSQRNLESWRNIITMAVNRMIPEDVLASSAMITIPWDIGYLSKENILLGFLNLYPYPKSYQQLCKRLLFSKKRNQKGHPILSRIPKDELFQMIIYWWMCEGLRTNQLSDVLLAFENYKPIKPVNPKIDPIVYYKKATFNWSKYIDESHLRHIHEVGGCLRLSYSESVRQLQPPPMINQEQQKRDIEEWN